MLLLRILIVLLIVGYSLIQGWYLELIIFLIAFIAGVIVESKSLSKKHLVKSNRKARYHAEDLCVLLSTLRRELTNYLIKRDPDRFIDINYKLLDEFKFIDSLSFAEQEAQERVLASKYPFWRDFDVLGTREFILYEDGFKLYFDKNTENIEQAYIDNAKFQYIKHLADRIDGGSVYDKPEVAMKGYLEKVQEYAKQIKDTKLHQKLTLAYREYRTYLLGGDNSSSREYDTSWFRALSIYHFAESRWGFHFKDTNEYGLVGRFISDDDKTYWSYYRSDKSFSEEIILDHLHIDELIFNPELDPPF